MLGVRSKLTDVTTFCRVDTYVRVNGRLNAFGNRVTVVSHAIRRITDFNEITFHYLDAIHTHLTLVKPNTSSAYVSIFYSSISIVWTNKQI